MTRLTDDIVNLFSPSGRLASMDGFEHREQQGVMATAIAEALETRTHLMVEAPTGVGKTLAYLVPTILHAQREHRRAIISTHTKNLQDQLFHKDLAIVRTLLDGEFHAEALKGRRNYLCTTRLQNALAAPRSLFGDEANEQLAALSRWAQVTPDGDVEMIPFAVSSDIWDMVCSERGICSPVSCGSACFFQRLKERVRQADLIIMNHALFFSLLAMKETDERFIFDNDFVVFDESHTLPTVAGAGIGMRISRHQVMASIHRLYNTRTKRGLLQRHGRRVKAACEELETEADGFFDTIGQAARSLTAGLPAAQSSAVRIRTPGLAINTLSAPLAAMQEMLETSVLNKVSAVMRPELDAVRQALTEIRIVVDDFLEQADPSFTYWVESQGQRGNIALCASPSDVGGVIGPRLFKAGTSVILTSATLAVNGTLDYSRSQIGAVDVRTLILDSPFDFVRQMRLYLAGEIPEPDAEGYAEQLPEWILRSIDMTGGKALVLFTSTSLMRQAAAALAEPLAERGIRLLVQGSSLPRHEMLEVFKVDIHSVLFGLESFWQGIDVPGEALEHVIITRLPFAVPNHPLIETRLEAIARRGGQAFLEYTLPEAVLKFRQGVGRLIRTRMDKGMVTVLDSRILRRSYGHVFLGSIPRSPIDVLTAAGDSEPLSHGEW